MNFCWEDSNTILTLIHTFTPRYADSELMRGAAASA